jgi:hypothetical protein
VTAPWIATVAALWLLVVVLAFAVLGALRRATSIFESFEASGVAPSFGAPVMSAVEPFELYERDGELVTWLDFVEGPTILLVMSPRCPSCTELVRRLGDIGRCVDDVPLVVVMNDTPEGRAVEFPPEMHVLYQRDAQATKALDNRATPQAYVVDATGLVFDRRIPNALDDLRKMARFQRTGGQIEAPAAEEAARA